MALNDLVPETKHRTPQILVESDDGVEGVIVSWMWPSKKCNCDQPMTTSNFSEPQCLKTQWYSIESNSRGDQCVSFCSQRHLVLFHCPEDIHLQSQKPLRTRGDLR